MSMSEEEDKNTIPSPIKIKKENSYTYWVNKDPNHFKDSKTDTKPKPLDPAEAKKLVEGGHSTSHSAWNTAGTWEEKGIDKAKVKQVLEQGILNFKSADGKVVITEMIKCEGNTQQVISKGKKRLGFNLQITLKYEGFGNLSESSGHIKFTEVEDDGNYEHEIEAMGPEDDDVRESVQKSLKAIAQAIFDSLNKLKE